jgi:ABC-2 type transport system permease protein
MIRHIRTVIWKEWKEIVLQRDRSRKDVLIRTAIAAVVFGFMVWRVGLAFVDNPMLLLLPAYVLLFCVIAIVTDSFAGERERHTLETLLASRLSDQSILAGKIASAVLLAWGVTFLVLVCGLVEVNLQRLAGHALILPVHRLVTVLVFSLFLLVFVSGAGVFVSLRSSTVRQATQILNISFMVLGFGLLYATVSLPAEWRARLLRALAGENQIRTEIAAALFFLALDAGLLAAARLRFRRNRLILGVD